MARTKQQASDTMIETELHEAAIEEVTHTLIELGDRCLGKTLRVYATRIPIGPSRSKRLNNVRRYGALLDGVFVVEKHPDHESDPEYAIKLAGEVVDAAEETRDSIYDHAEFVVVMGDGGSEEFVAWFDLTVLMEPDEPKLTKDDVLRFLFKHLGAEQEMQARRAEADDKWKRFLGDAGPQIVTTLGTYLSPRGEKSSEDATDAVLIDVLVSVIESSPDLTDALMTALAAADPYSLTGGPQAMQLLAQLHARSVARRGGNSPRSEESPPIVTPPPTSSVGSA